MNLSKLWEIVKDREAWRAAVHGFTKSRTRMSNWTTTTTNGKWSYLSSTSTVHGAARLGSSLSGWHHYLHMQMCALLCFLQRMSLPSSCLKAAPVKFVDHKSIEEGRDLFFFCFCAWYLPPCSWAAHWGVQLVLWPCSPTLTRDTFFITPLLSFGKMKQCRILPHA